MSIFFPRIVSRCRSGTSQAVMRCQELRVFDRMLPALLLAGIFVFSGHVTFVAPPSSFPYPSILVVQEGETLASIAEDLESRHMVQSAYSFKAIARGLGGNTSVRAGSYFFAEPENAFIIAMRLIGASYGLDAVKVTIPEGAAVEDIAFLLGKALAPFDAEAFIKTAQIREGYLYPDTYFLFPGQDPISIRRVMEENFRKKIEELSDAISQFGKPLDEVVILASIIEKEASDEHDRQIISGILWKRLEIGMPLQVDATFGYVLDKKLTLLTRKDLATDSPYNTYLNKGLPPTPISNPSLSSLHAAISPIETNYLYYLSDRRGVTHYASTYEGHLANKRKYLGS